MSYLGDWPTDLQVTSHCVELAHEDLNLTPMVLQASRVSLPTAIVALACGGERPRSHLTCAVEPPTFLHIH